MFKVSLLPESYRKQLIGKKNKDIILSVALVVLMCMLIVYAGVAVRLLVLKTQEKAVQKRNAEIVQRINELSPYVNDFNNLAIAEANYENIKPVDITVMEMVNILQSLTPNYVEITSIYAPEWQSNQVCVIEGKLSSANNLGSAISMLEDYQNIIKGNAEIKDAIKQLKVVNDEPIVNVDNATGTREYSFRIIISLSGSINIDQQTGTIVTTTTTTTESTTESTTAAASEEPTDSSTVEPSTLS